ncbi:MAG: recombinase family protein [Planctomycetota bacterium]|nr:recombinase family protein [Planctomycetota bacterium]
MKKAIALIRVSTPGQAKEDRGGIAGQRADIARLALQHGFTLVSEVEIQVSGTRVLENAEFRALLDRIQDPEIEAVVCADLDRLLRPEDFGSYIVFSYFRDSGTVIVTNAGVRDLHRDRLLTVLETEIGTLERARIRERTMRGRNELRRQGRHVSGPLSLPYGVAYAKASGVWSYTEPEAGIVRALFRRFLAGEQNLAALGRAVGVDRRQARRILTQSLYTGLKTIPDLDEPLRVIKEPLIPEDQFRTAQALLRKRGRGPHAKEGTGGGLFRGILACRSCEVPMHAHRERRRGQGGSWQYRCRIASGKGRIAAHCSTGSLLARVVDLEVHRVIEGRLADTEALLGLLDAALPEVVRSVPVPAARISKLQAERERVVIGFERGMRTADAAEKRTREIDVQLGALQEEAEVAQSVLGADRDEVAALVVEAFSDWSFLSPAQQRQILKPLVREIVIERTGRAQCRVVSLDLVLSAPAPPDLRPGAMLVSASGPLPASRARAAPGTLP